MRHASLSLITHRIANYCCSSTSSRSQTPPAPDSYCRRIQHPKPATTLGAPLHLIILRMRVSTKRPAALPLPLEHASERKFMTWGGVGCVCVCVCACVRVCTHHHAGHHQLASLSLARPRLARYDDALGVRFRVPNRKQVVFFKRKIGSAFDNGNDSPNLQTDNRFKFRPPPRT